MVCFCTLKIAMLQLQRNPACGICLHTLQIQRVTSEVAQVKRERDRCSAEVRLTSGYLEWFSASLPRCDRCCDANSC